MQPHQQRVVDEKTSLDEKIQKLAAFIDTDTFDGLPDDEQDRLERQMVVMNEYSEILGERIAAFA